jgi:hypothetical protein
MAHRGHALAIAVTSGLGSAGAFDDLAPERRPHLRLRGVDELLSLPVPGLTGTEGAMVTAPHHDSYRRIAAEEAFRVPEVYQATRDCAAALTDDTAVS